MGECKWKEDVNALDILATLDKKASFVDKKITSYAVFAKSFSTRIQWEKSLLHRYKRNREKN